jgi:hypothetical protein
MNYKRSTSSGYKEKARFQSFTSIVQSSGMGKSRVVDEVAKRIFALPFNIRNSGDDTGERRYGLGCLVSRVILS